MAHDVFISYSSQDAAAAEGIRAGLESRGIKCWIAPRDIVPGSDWGDSILRAITASRAVVFILSSHANAKQQQIKRELNHALSMSVPIIPVRIEDVKPADSLQYYLSVTQGLDAFSDSSEAVDRVADAVATFLASRGVAGGAAEQSTPAPYRPPAGSAVRNRRTLLAALAVAALLGVTALAWWWYTDRSGARMLRSARPGTVRIEVDGQFVAAGFFVSNTGHVLTSAYVEDLRAGRAIRVKVADGTRRTVTRELRRDGHLLLLDAPGTGTVTPLPIEADAVQPGSPVFAFRQLGDGEWVETSAHVVDVGLELPQFGGSGVIKVSMRDAGAIGTPVLNARGGVIGVLQGHFKGDPNHAYVSPASAIAPFLARND